MTPKVIRAVTPVQGYALVYLATHGHRFLYSVKLTFTDAQALKAAGYIDHEEPPPAAREMTMVSITEKGRDLVDGILCMCGRCMSDRGEFES